jgi:hypothetical protein
MNNIEQYKKRFYNLMESTMGDAKPLINEEEQSMDENWSKIVSSLVPTSPKQIKMKDGDHSLNWGSHSGPGNDWGMSISKVGTFSFQSDDPQKGKLVFDLTQKYGFPVKKMGTHSGLYLNPYTSFPIDKLIPLIREIINLCKQKV